MFHLGQNIDKIAQKKGFTVRDLANHLQKSEKAIYDILKKEHLNTEILFSLSVLFDVPITHFFEDAGNESTLEYLPKKNTVALHPDIERLVEKKVREILRAEASRGEA